MQSDDSRSMVGGFTYVRDVYRNCARMLKSCDPILRDRKFVCYDWAILYKYEKYAASIDYPDFWLDDYLIRQYYPIPGVEGENQILTIAAIPWRRDNPDSFEPLCLASRFLATGTPNDVYWISVMQMHEQGMPCNGEVHILGENLGWLGKDPKKLETFKSLVKGRKVASLAVPLLDITNTNQLVERVIEPILSCRWPLEAEE